MKIAYLDCFSGISGNMTLGALLHAGLDRGYLLSELKRLGLSGYRVEIEPARRGTIAGLFVRITVEQEQPPRNLDEILRLIDESGLSAWVRERSKAAFLRLGRAEAQVHGQDLSQVHFHEVGAVDAIVDIVGAMIGLEALGVREVAASPVNVGRGTVASRHGTLPVPAPATAVLLQGKPTYSAGPALELTTPTGAVLATSLAREFGGQPLMRVESVGYGLGSADPEAWPNCLRVLVGERVEEADDHGWMIETNVDDMNPEFCGFVSERLFAAGARDVFFTPIVMKKGRPAAKISVLAPAGREQALAGILFRETSAIGLRRYRVERDTLDRKVIRVRTQYGEVPVKVAYLEGEVVNLSPEYEACRERARDKGVPLKRVYEAAVQAAREGVG